MRKYFFLRFVLFCIIFGGSIFLLFFNPYFKISHWKIDGAQMVDAKSLDQLIQIEFQKKWFFFRQDNFFIALLKSNYLEKVFKKHFLDIENIQIKPNWKENPFSNFIMIIKERQKAGIWCNNNPENSCFYFDSNGYLFRKSPESKGPFIIEVTDTASLGLGLGGTVGDANLVSGLLSLQKELKKLPDLVIENITIINQNYDFIMQLTNGWKLYFDPKIDVVNQFRVFNVLILEKKISPTDRIEYIDLRIKNKAYIKRF